MGDGSVVARMAEDVKRLNEERRGGNRVGEAGSVEPEPLAGAEPTQPPPEDPGPPRIKGVDVENAGVVTSVGNCSLTGPEVEQIVRICLGALRRAQQEMWEQVASNHKIQRLRKRG